MTPLETTYAGRKFRSRTEARWSLFMDACGIRHDYEADGFRLPSGPYLPDFWLQDFNLFLEIKGQEPTELERRKCIELARLSERPVLLAVGAPEPRFQITWFGGDEEEGEDLPLYVIARDRISETGFWLLAEDQARWLGGGVTALGSRGPMLSGAIDRAYTAALSARFDTEEARRRHPVIRETDPMRYAA